MALVSWAVAAAAAFLVVHWWGIRRGYGKHPEVARESVAGLTINDFADAIVLTDAAYEKSGPKIGYEKVLDNMRAARHKLTHLETLNIDGFSASAFLDPDKNIHIGVAGMNFSAATREERLRDFGMIWNYTAAYPLQNADNFIGFIRRIQRNYEQPIIAVAGHSSGPLAIFVAMAWGRSCCRCRPAFRYSIRPD